MAGNITDLVDGRIIHILDKIENNPSSEVVNELALDSEVEDLLEIRKALFLLVKERFEFELRKIDSLGEDESSGIKLANRTERSLGTSVAKEIVKQYKYIMQMTNGFPRCVLSRDTKYLDLITVNEKNDDDIQVMNSHLAEKTRVVELMNITKEQQKVIKKN